MDTDRLRTQLKDLLETERLDVSLANFAAMLACELAGNKLENLQALQKILEETIDQMRDATCNAARRTTILVVIEFALATCTMYALEMQELICSVRERNTEYKRSLTKRALLILADGMPHSIPTLSTALGVTMNVIHDVMDSGVYERIVTASVDATSTFHYTITDAGRELLKQKSG